jgi:ferrous iron transport protein A
MSSLADLAVGQAARVAGVEGTDEISIRLMEMGLVPGTELRVLGKAPLGDPLEIEVRGYRLSVRKSEAARVQLASSESCKNNP